MRLAANTLRAYAAWAGKRLPTEIEWQFAAQTSAGNEWPWKQATPVTRKEQVVNETLAVSALEGLILPYVISVMANYILLENIHVAQMLMACRI